MSAPDAMEHRQLEEVYVELGHLGHALVALFEASVTDDVPPERMRAGGWLAEQIADRARLLIRQAEAAGVARASSAESQP